MVAPEREGVHCRLNGRRTVTQRYPILCDGPDLAVDCACVADALGADIDPRPSASPLDEARSMIARGEAVAIAAAHGVTPEALVQLARASEASGAGVLLAGVGGDAATRDLARDLGIVAVDELRPLIAVIQLLRAGASRPWTSSARTLPEIDRARLASVLRTSERGGGRLVRVGSGHIGWLGKNDEPAVLGETRDVVAALEALREAEIGARPAMPTVEGVERQAVLDVIFGPPRALSDPASKAALAPYDLPLPVEELCTSPSRAASEAARIGFPVRIALASPDLRVWDHPDLAVDAVDNAARVRDVFRQIHALAKTRAPEARLLGVTVGAMTPAKALLRLRVRPLPGDLTVAEIAFGDPHGLASDDRTMTVLPASIDRIELVLGRLRGRALLLGASAPERREAAASLGDVLLRVAAFVHEWRREIVSVEIDPVALLVGGAVEVREACVTVGDAFVRSLDAPASP